MFAFQWREFSPPLSSAHRQKRDRRPYNFRGTQNTYFSPPPPPIPTRAINQWARCLEYRHAVTLHILVGKICITFFPFSYEACSFYLVLWLCALPTDLRFWLLLYNRQKNGSQIANNLYEIVVKMRTIFHCILTTIS